jgi:hypothetical protein
MLRTNYPERALAATCDCSQRLGSGLHYTWGKACRSKIGILELVNTDWTLLSGDIERRGSNQGAIVDECAVELDDLTALFGYFATARRSFAALSLCSLDIDLYSGPTNCSEQSN